MQTLHRARDRLVGERTALINQLRAILLDRGFPIAKGRRNLERELDAMLYEEKGLAVSPRLRKLIEDMREEWRVLDRRIAAFDDEFASRAKNDERARRLATILGRLLAGGRSWKVLWASPMRRSGGLPKGIFRRRRFTGTWNEVAPTRRARGSFARIDLDRLLLSCGQDREGLISAV